MTNSAAVLAALPALPLMCGRAGDAEHGDLNRDWECKRSRRIYDLHLAQDEIRNAETRREKVLTVRSPRLGTRLDAPRRAARLAEWIAYATERHARVAARVLSDLPDCTHGYETRGERSVQESFPASCTAG